MPRIQEYGRQIAAPNIERTSAENVSKAGIEGRALQDVGHAIISAGAAAAQRTAQEDVSNISAGLADTAATFQQRIDEGVNQGSLDQQKLLEDLNSHFDKLSEGIGSRAGQNYFTRQSANIRASILRASNHGMASIAGADAVANFQTTLDKSSSLVYTTPSEFKNSLSFVNEAIDMQVMTGALKPDASQRLKAHAQSVMAESALKGWARLDPNEARQRLHSGEFNDYFDGKKKSEVEGYIDGQERATRAQSINELRLAEEARKIQAEAWKSDFIGRMSKGNYSVKEIMDAPALKAEEKLQLLAASERTIKNITQNDPRVFNRAVQEVLDGKVQSIIDLAPKIGRGMSPEQAKQIESFRKTLPGEQYIQESRRILFKDATKVITPKIAIGGIDHPDDQGRLMSFTLELQQREETLRREGKLTPSFYDPKNADGAYGIMRKYKQSPQDLFNAMIGKPPSTNPEPQGAAPQDEKARLPGETPAQYLERTKGK